MTILFWCRMRCRAALGRTAGGGCPHMSYARSLDCARAFARAPLGMTMECQTQGPSTALGMTMECQTQGPSTALGMTMGCQTQGPSTAREHSLALRSG